MDEKVLETAMKRFDDAVTQFEAKHAERVGDLEDRVNELEAIESVGTRGGGSATDRRIQAESKALRSFVATGEIDLQVLQRGEAKALSLGGGSDILQPERIANEIIKLARGTSALVGLVRNTQSSTGDYRRNVRVTPPAIAWSTELGARSDQTEPLYRQVTPLGGEAYGVYSVSNWLLNDSMFPLETEMTQEFGLQLGRGLESAIISGAGASGEPKGFLTQTPTTDQDFASPLRNADAVQLTAAPSPDSLVDHLMDTYFSLHPSYRTRSTWVMNSQTLATIRKTKDSTGAPIFQQNFATGVDADGTILGRPVVVSEFMADVGQSPAGFPVAIADWQQAYELVRVGNFTLIRDTVTSKGQTRLYLAVRYLGRLINNDAIKVANR